MEVTDNITPKPKAFSASIFPTGIGLFFVLSIRESISLSNHMLIAPAAPAPNEIQNIDNTNKNG